jgi:AbrB family looped-hinge helix DNA binding protein
MRLFLVNTHLLPQAYRSSIGFCNEFLIAPNRLFCKFWELFWQNIFICHFHVILSVVCISVEVGKYGRIVLPKKLRKKYELHEGFRLIITESNGRICLTPVKIYEHPTEALFGSLKVSKPIDEPKSLAREYIRKKLAEDMQ